MKLVELSNLLGIDAESFQRLVDTFSAAGKTLYLVGGSVRDLQRRQLQ